MRIIAVLAKQPKNTRWPSPTRCSKTVCVGNTTGSDLELLQSPVHPHMRGEHKRLEVKQDLLSSVPPCNQQCHGSRCGLVWHSVMALGLLSVLIAHTSTPIPHSRSLIV